MFNIWKKLRAKDSHRHEYLSPWGQIYPLPMRHSTQWLCACGHWRIDWGHGQFEEGEAGQGHTWGTGQGDRFDRFPENPANVLANSEEARGLGAYLVYTAHGPISVTYPSSE